MRKLIAARFASKCRVCKLPVALGEPVYWEKGTRGVTHKACEPVQAQSSNESGEPVKGRTAADLERRTFSIDWADLKASMLGAFTGKPPRMNLRENQRRFVEYLTDPGTGWAGFTGSDVRRWLERGYQLDGLNFLNPPIPVRERRRLRFNDEAGELEVDKALSGDDLPFAEWSKVEAIPGLAVEIETSFSAATSHEVCTAYYQFVCRAVYALEQAGIDLQVSLVNTVSNLYSKSPRTHATVIRVKRENEATDFHSWSAMLSPASLRAYGFAASLLHADAENLPAAGGMGTCDVPYLQEWKVQYNPARGVIEFLAHTHGAKSFPAEAMESQLRESLHALHRGY